MISSGEDIYRYQIRMNMLRSLRYNSNLTLRYLMEPTPPVQTLVEEDLVIDPYSIVNKSGQEIDYDILIKKFGCSPITPELLERMA